MRIFLSNILLFVIGCSLSEAIHFVDCGSKSKVASVAVSGCGKVDVCPLKKGTNATVSINFNSETVTANKITAVVHGKIAGVFVPFKPPNTDGCIKSGIDCPTVPKKAYSYHNIIPVMKFYPPIELIVKWELQDEHGKDIVCVLIPCKIVS